MRQFSVGARWRGGAVMSLRALFDAAAEVYSDVTLWEDRAPSARYELAAWAAERGLDVRMFVTDLPDDPTVLVSHRVGIRGSMAHSIQVLERIPRGSHGGDQ